MRRANTTFLNLRAALDDLDPLVDDSKPVAKKLRPFLAELRPLARDARPTLRDLAQILSRPGADNDALELTRLQVPLRDATVREVEANGAKRETRVRGRSPSSVRDYAPIIASVRPYAPDALGWFDDFSHSGIYDALGAASRVGIHASAFTAANGAALAGAAGAARGQAFEAGAALNQRNRCPGGGRAQERGRLQPVEAGRGRLRSQPRCSRGSRCGASSPPSCSWPSPRAAALVLTGRRRQGPRRSRTTRSSSTTPSGSSRAPT